MLICRKSVLILSDQPRNHILSQQARSPTSLSLSSTSSGPLVSFAHPQRLSSGNFPYSRQCFPLPRTEIPNATPQDASQPHRASRFQKSSTSTPAGVLNSIPPSNLLPLPSHSPIVGPLYSVCLSNRTEIVYEPSCPPKSVQNKHSHVVAVVIPSA